MTVCISETTEKDTAWLKMRLPGRSGVTPRRRRMPCSRQVTSRNPTPRLTHMIAQPDGAALAHELLVVAVHHRLNGAGGVADVDRVRVVVVDQEGRGAVRKLA